MDEEGIPIFRGIGVCDTRELPLGEWPRRGGRGTFLYLNGCRERQRHVPGRSASGRRAERRESTSSTSSTWSSTAAAAPKCRAGTAPTADLRVAAWQPVHDSAERHVPTGERDRVHRRCCWRRTTRRRSSTSSSTAASFSTTRTCRGAVYWRRRTSSKPATRSRRIRCAVAPPFAATCFPTSRIACLPLDNQRAQRLSPHPALLPRLHSRGGDGRIHRRVPERPVLQSALPRLGRGAGVPDGQGLHLQLAGGVRPTAVGGRPRRTGEDSGVRARRPGRRGAGRWQLVPPTLQHWPDDPSRDQLLGRPERGTGDTTKTRIAKRSRRGTSMASNRAVGVSTTGTKTHMCGSTISNAWRRKAWRRICRTRSSCNGRLARCACSPSPSPVARAAIWLGFRCWRLLGSASVDEGSFVSRKRRLHPRKVAPGPPPALTLRGVFWDRRRTMREVCFEATPSCLETMAWRGSAAPRREAARAAPTSRETRSAARRAAGRLGYCTFTWPNIQGCGLQL